MPDENLDYRNILESTKKVLHPGMLLLFYDALMYLHWLIAKLSVVRIVPVSMRWLLNITIAWSS
jgi:hypothetical protein